MERILSTGKISPHFNFIEDPRVDHAYIVIADKRVNSKVTLRLYNRLEYHNRCTKFKLELLEKYTRQNY